MPLPRPGLLVWKDGHVGVYVGNGVVVESRGVDSGVVRTFLKDRPWTNWAECFLVDYAATPSEDWEQRAIAAEAKAAALATRVDQELPVLQARVAERENDREALKAALLKVMA